MGQGLGLGIGIADLALGLGLGLLIRIGDWPSGMWSGFGLGTGDWDWGSEIKKSYWEWGLHMGFGLKLRFGIRIPDWVLEIRIMECGLRIAMGDMYLGLIPIQHRENHPFWKVKKNCKKW